MRAVRETGELPAGSNIGRCPARGCPARQRTHYLSRLPAGNRSRARRPSPARMRKATPVRGRLAAPVVTEPRFGTAWAALLYAACVLALMYPALGGQFLVNPSS